MKGFQEKMEKAKAYQEGQEHTAQWAEEHPALASIASIPVGAAQGLDYLGQLVGNVGHNDTGDLENYVPADIYNMHATNFVRTVRGTVAQKIEENPDLQVELGGQNIYSFLYQTGMSMGDFLFNAMVTGNFSGGLGGTGSELGRKAASNLSLAVMGSGAASNATVDAIERGLSNKQAYTLGAIAGLAEIVTEKVSLETLLDKTALDRNAVGYLFKNVLAEGSEEVASDLINWAADVLVSKDRSQWSQSIAEYEAQEYTPGEALGLALKDQAIDMGMSFLGGGLSGGVMAGGSIALNSYQNRGTGSGLEQKTAPVKGAVKVDTSLFDRGILQNFNAARKWLVEYARTKFPAQVVNAETGKTIGISRTGLDKFLSGNISFEKYASGFHIPELIETAHKVAEATNKHVEQVDNIPTYEYYESPFEIEGKNYMAYIRVRNTRVGDKYYGHTVSEVEDIKIEPSARTSVSETPNEQPVYAIDDSTSDTIIPQGVEGVKEEYAPGGAGYSGMQGQRDIRQILAQRSINAFGQSGQKAMQSLYKEGTDPGTYYGGFAAYYDAGVAGVDLKKVTGPYAGALNDAQKLGAWIAGQNDTKAAREKQRKAAQYASVAGKDSGLVYDSYVRENVDGKDFARLNAGCKKLGVRARYVEEIDGGIANGKIQKEEILLAKDMEDPLRFTIGHEWTHRVMELSPDAYYSFRDAIGSENYQKAEYILDLYQRKGLEISYEEALDEATADYAGRMLADGKLLDEFLNRNQDNRTMLQKMLDAIREIIGKLMGREKTQAQTVEEKLLAALEAAAEQVKTLEAEGQKKSGQGDGEGKYSLKMFEDGKRFVDVETDQAQFDSLTDREKLDLAEKVIRERFVGKVIGTENRVFVNAGGAREYGHPAKTITGATLDAKARVSTELDNLVDAGFNFRTAPDGADGHVHKGTEWFEYFDVIFKVGDSYFQGVINVQKNKRGRLFKDVTKIKNVTESIYGSYGKNPLTVSLHNVSKNSIPQSEGEVNGKFSLKGTTAAGDLATLVKENEKLKAQVEWWKGQTRRTAEAQPEARDLGKMAKELVKSYQSTLKPGELAGELGEMWKSLNSRGATYEQLMEKAYPVAESLVRSARAEAEGLATDYRDAAEYLRKTKIMVPKELWGELEQQGGYGEFRKQNFGKLKLSSVDGLPIDVAYKEMAEMWPGLFSETEHSAEGDQLVYLSEVAEQLQPTYENPYRDGYEQAVEEAAHEMVRGLMEGKVGKAPGTMMDRYLAQAKRESGQLIQKLREKDVKGRESRRLTETKRQLERVAKSLSQKVLKPTDAKHVPENLRKPLAKALASVNLESGFDWGFEDGKRFQVEKGEGTPTKRTEAFIELRHELEKLDAGETVVMDPDLFGPEGYLEAVLEGRQSTCRCPRRKRRCG